MYFRDNALIGAIEILGRLPLVFTVGYLARSVGTEAFGSWTLILAYQAFLAGIVGLGLSSSLSRLASVCNAGDSRNYLVYGLQLSLAGSLVAGVLTLLFQNRMGAILGIDEELRWLLPLAIMLTAGSAVDSQLDAFFKARAAVRRQVAFILTRTLVEIMAVLVVFATNLLPIETVGAQLAVYIGMVVLGKTMIYPSLLVGMGEGRTSLSNEQRFSFLHYGLPLVPTMVVAWFIAQGDRLVLSHFVDKHDLGLYAFGASLAAYLVFLGYAVYPLLLPHASRLYDASDHAGVRTVFRQSQQLFISLWMAVMVVLALWSREVIELTAGSEFAAAHSVLVVLCLAVGVEQLLGIYQYAFHLVKKPLWILWLNLLYGGMLALSLTIAGYAKGVAWAPWAVLITTLAFNVVRYRFARQYLDLPMAPGLLAQIAGVVVMTVALDAVAGHLSPLVRLVIAGIIALPMMVFSLQHYRAGQCTSTPPFNI